MRIGNWFVKESTIEWDGGSPNKFVIEIQQLLETERVADREQELYKWILAATAEDWLSEDELYDLNFAFMYAAGAAGLIPDYSVFDSTVEYQFEILEEEEDEDE